MKDKLNKQGKYRENNVENNYFIFCLFERKPNMKETKMDKCQK